MMRQDGTIRDRLREATRDAHLRLHDNAAFAALLDGRLTRDGYAALLGRLYRLHAPIEDGLAAWAGDPKLAWWRPMRARRLRADLAALGRDAPNATTAPALASAAAALGCAWVIEGSALGGQVMSRRVTALLDGTGGGSFFAPDPEQPARWRACCAAIEAEAGAVEEMEDAARLVFAAFEAGLAEQAVLF